MNRRLFDHLYAEISVAVGVRVPRYALWLDLQDLGWNPDSISTHQALAFIEREMAPFLAQFGLAIPPRACRRLRRLVVQFDPTRPTPFERFESWGRSR